MKKILMAAGLLASAVIAYLVGSVLIEPYFPRLKTSLVLGTIINFLLVTAYGVTSALIPRSESALKNCMVMFVVTLLAYLSWHLIGQSEYSISRIGMIIVVLITFAFFFRFSGLHLRSKRV